MDKELTLDTADPVALLQSWLEEARESEPFNHDAVALATADAGGKPSVRMVLVKQCDERGLVFYTNSESRKGLELAQNPHASMCFYWKSLRREARIDGVVEKAAAEEADAYFASRDRSAQIGAWASDQSRPMDGRFDLEKRVARFTAKYPIGAVPRPPHWEGYRLVPSSIEFWQERRFRLHDRIIYNRRDDRWVPQRLFP